MTISETNLIGVIISGFLASTLASIAGIGGGGMLIPLYSIIGGVEIKEAIIMSIITITGNSLIRALYYFNKKHYGTKNRYIPEYNIIRIVSASDANTAYLGFLLNRILPDIVIFVFVIILMSILIYKTGKKAVEYFKSRHVNDDIVVIVDNIEINLDTIAYKEGEPDKKGETFLNLINNLLYVFLTIGLISFLSVIRKSSNHEWLIYIIQVVLMIPYIYMTINHIKCEYKLRKKTKFNFLSSDIKWSNKEAPLKYVIAGSITGFISTMLGIGGGMIMNPIMISLGLSPDVVVATSSITTVFSSFISAFQFLLDGIYEWYYPILFGVGCASSIVSLFILKLLKSNMKIGITFILVITLIVSFIFLMVINIMKFI